MNERSSHDVPTPHGGGIAIALAWFGGLGYLYLTEQIEANLFYALFAGVIISAVSFFDDIYELSPKIRLATQALVATCGLVAIGGLQILDFGVFNISNVFLANLFAFLLIIWFINLYNFLDGINGYAGSEAIFLACAGFALFGGSHFVILGAAVFGFLFWNYNKAKIFMGDVGSTLLGYNTAIFTIYYANQSSQNLWIWIMLFGLFWLDATITLFRRWKNREKLSQAHKKHAYQRLTQAGWTHFKVANFSIAVNLAILAIVYFVRNIAIAFTLVLILLYAIMKFIDKKRQFT